ncbi:hypothetical protein AVEN_82368-1, partial [Araneus ventricosus]
WKVPLSSDGQGWCFLNQPDMKTSAHVLNRRHLFFEAPRYSTSEQQYGEDHLLLGDLILDELGVCLADLHDPDICLK